MWSRSIHGLRFDGNAVSAAVLRSVIRAGGEPLTLFAESSLTAAERLQSFDALLLPGGFDIDPRRYGEDPLASTNTADMAEQDQFEADLLDAAVSLGLPVLAICRGFQMVNVSHGGSLVQDLPSESVHRSSTHQVSVEADSRLAQALACTEFPVSSYHHQAIARVGAGLRAVAIAPDGVIEALEPMSSRIPLIAVQWHPEDSAAENEQQHAIFSWLVNTAIGQKQ